MIADCTLEGKSATITEIDRAGAFMKRKREKIHLECVRMQRSKRLILICPKSNSPVGGNKILYKSIDRINELEHQALALHLRKSFYKGPLFKISKFFGFESRSLESYAVDFRYKWFENSTRVYQNGERLSPETDILVIPEVLVSKLATRAMAMGFEYGIFVQNGHLIDSGLEDIGANSLEKIYLNATIVLSISDHTSKLIKMAFPSLPNSRLNRVLVDVAVASDGTKENIITYMPRKLSLHSKKLLFFMRNCIPPSWSFQPLDQMSEDRVLHALRRSKIFLAFSEFEGCALPPLEAAMARNIVVGYTGGGCEEYFSPPIFRQVENGDYLGLCREVLAAINEWSEWADEPAEIREARIALGSRYNRTAQASAWNKVLHALQRDRGST